MKIRRETDYAFRAVRALYQSEGQPLFSQEIAKAESIPPTYILVIMSKLVNAGFVKTLYQHGDSKGGYVLSADPAVMTLYDIYQLFEGDMKISECLRDECKCCHIRTCKVHLEMIRLNNVLIDEMKRKSIKDILSEEQE